MNEVEVRSFLSEEEYQRIIAFFKKEGGTTDVQEITMYNAPADLRLIRSHHLSKICMKKGDLHDVSREEIEVEVKSEDIASLQKIFATLGLQEKIKWYRTRHTVFWEGVQVTIDDIRGAGFVFELEIQTDGDTNIALATLREKLRRLNITETSKEEERKRFSYYATHWKELTK